MLVFVYFVEGIVCGMFDCGLFVMFGWCEIVFVVGFFVVVLVYVVLFKCVVKKLCVMF